MFEADLSTLVSKDTDLGKVNDDFLQEHHSSAPHVQAALRVRAHILDSAMTEKCSQDMIRTLGLENSDLEDATRGLEYLKGFKADQKYIDDYIAAANARYPEANAFDSTKAG